MPLTPRERLVLQMLVDGLKRPEIAVRLHINRNTLRRYIWQARDKLYAETIEQAVCIAYRERYINIKPCEI